MDEIETVAMAIYNAYDELGAGHRAAWANLTADEKRNYLYVAAAAVKAMRAFGQSTRTEASDGG